MPEIENTREPRELTVVQKFWDGGANIKNLSPAVQKVEVDKETEEAEEAMTPAPKVFTAPESVDSSTSPPTGEPPSPASPVPPLPTHTTDQSGADTGSGKDSDANEDEPQTPTETKSDPDDSSPDSSTEEKSGGSSEPPAPKLPPTVASPPVAPTTPK